MKKWAASYFDHYEKYLGHARRRDVFEMNNASRKIQVLSYLNVFPETVTFCTIGLSHFSNQIGEVCELMMIVDDGWEYCPKLLAETASFIASKPMRAGWGMAVSGNKKTDPVFYEKFQKDAIYVTHPMGFQDGFYTVTSKNSDLYGSIYMAIPISEEEFDLFKEVGAEKFEEIMQDNEVDPIDIGRESLI